MVRYRDSSLKNKRAEQRAGSSEVVKNPLYYFFMNCLSGNNCKNRFGLIYYTLHHYGLLFTTLQSLA